MVELYFVTMSSGVWSFMSGPAERISVSVAELEWKNHGVPQ